MRRRNCREREQGQEGEMGRFFSVGRLTGSGFIRGVNDFVFLCYRDFVAIACF